MIIFNNQRDHLSYGRVKVIVVVIIKFTFYTHITFWLCRTCQQSIISHLSNIIFIFSSGKCSASHTPSDRWHRALDGDKIKYIYKKNLSPPSKKSGTSVWVRCKYSFVFWGKASCLSGRECESVRCARPTYACRGK